MKLETGATAGIFQEVSPLWDWRRCCGVGGHILFVILKNLLPEIERFMFTLLLSQSKPGSRDSHYLLHNDDASRECRRASAHDSCLSTARFHKCPREPPSHDLDVSFLTSRWQRLDTHRQRFPLCISIAIIPKDNIALLYSFRKLQRFLSFGRDNVCKCCI